MSPSGRRILVVDDEEPISAFVSYNLKRAGYEVECAPDGGLALALLDGGRFDLVILDIMLPGVDGLEVCRRVRQTSEIPILFLSAKDSEIDKVVGLEIGGDDYLIKPFGIHELVARVKALLRRGRPEAQPRDAAGGSPGEGLLAGGLGVDEKAHRATYGEVDLDLTPREFELLACLARNAGRVLSRDQLLEDAWGWENLVESKTVDTHVKRLRDKLAAAGADPAVVETVRGYGYRLRRE